MKVVTSLLFNILFYCNLIMWVIVHMPVLVLPQRYVLGVARRWSASSLWLLEHVAGIKADFRHLERIPNQGILVASKHQSFWETFALFQVFDAPAFVLKRELTWIPIFGWYLKKVGCVAVNRETGEQSVRGMVTQVKEILRQGRQVIIFPEGTRRAPGAPPDYKRGIVLLYRMCKAPCVPVALNSGLFWPRRRFIRNPGTVVVEICPAIEPGQHHEVFLNNLQTTIEETTERLIRDHG